MVTKDFLRTALSNKDGGLSLADSFIKMSAGNLSNDSDAAAAALLIDNCSIGYQHGHFMGLTGLLLFLSFFSLVIQLMFHYILSDTGYLHQNVWFLLQNYSLASLFNIVHIIVKTVYNILLINGVSLVERVFNPLCAVLSIPYTVSTISQMITMTALAAERWHSTVNKRFEDPSKSPLFHGYMIALTWSFNALFCMYRSARLWVTDATEICYCYVHFTGQQWYDIIFYYGFDVVTQALTIVIWMKVYNMNRDSLQWNRNSLNNSLDSRFQKWNNVSLSRMLVPVAILRSTFQAICVLLKAAFLRDHYDNSSIYTVQFLYCLELIKMSSVAVYCIVRMKPLQKRLIKILTQLLFWVSDERLAKLNNLVQPPVGTGDIVDYKLDPYKYQEIMKSVWERADVKQPPSVIVRHRRSEAVAPNKFIKTSWTPASAEAHFGGRSRRRSDEGDAWTTKHDTTARTKSRSSKNEQEETGGYTEPAKHEIQPPAYPVSEISAFKSTSAFTAFKERPTTTTAAAPASANTREEKLTNNNNNNTKNYGGSGGRSSSSNIDKELSMSKGGDFDRERRPQTMSYNSNNSNNNNSPQTTAAYAANKTPTTGTGTRPSQPPPRTTTSNSSRNNGANKPTGAAIKDLQVSVLHEAPPPRNVKIEAWTRDNRVSPAASGPSLTQRREQRHQQLTSNHSSSSSGRQRRQGQELVLPTDDVAGTARNNNTDAGRDQVESINSPEFQKSVMVRDAPATSLLPQI